MAIRDNWNDVANTPIEREQMAQMMYNALVDKGIKLPSYEEYVLLAASAEVNKDKLRQEATIKDTILFILYLFSNLILTILL